MPALTTDQPLECVAVDADRCLEQCFCQPRIGTHAASRACLRGVTQARSPEEIARRLRRGVAGAAGASITKKGRWG